MAMNEKEKALYWLVVGYVSPKAKQSILALGGRVDEISHEPPFTAVGLAHDPSGYWTWSHGRHQHRGAIEFWDSGEIRLQHITLLRGPRNAECYSVEETYLIQPDEDFDAATGILKEQDKGEEQGNIAKTCCRMRQNEYSSLCSPSATGPLFCQDDEAQYVLPADLYILND